jgi:hypothetical protein
MLDQISKRFTYSNVAKTVKLQILFSTSSFIIHINDSKHGLRQLVDQHCFGLAQFYAGKRNRMNPVQPLRYGRRFSKLKFGVKIDGRERLEGAHLEQSGSAPNVFLAPSYGYWDC